MPGMTVHWVMTSCSTSDWRDGFSLIVTWSTMFFNVDSSGLDSHTHLLTSMSRHRYKWCPNISSRTTLIHCSWIRQSEYERCFFSLQQFAVSSQATSCIRDSSYIVYMYPNLSVNRHSQYSSLNAHLSSDNVTSLSLQLQSDLSRRR